MRVHTLSALVAVSLLAVSPVRVEAKDLTLRQRVTTGGVVAGTHESTQYWVGHRIVTDGPTNRVIFDLDAETMTMADKRQQTYFTQTFAETRQQADQMKAQMEKQLDKMPPEARAMMEKMGMPSTAETAVSVKPTGKSEKIAGYEAKEYTFEAGPMAGSVWATDALQPPGGAKATEAFSKMMGVAAPGANVAQAIGKIPGVPLRTSFRSGAGAQTFSTTTEVVEVSEKAPPAGVLTVPDGFKKVESPLSRMHAPKGAPAH